MGIASLRQPSWLGLTLLLSAWQVSATDYEDALKGFESQSGLFEAHYNAATAQVLVTLPAQDANGINGEAIYASRLSHGLGSNPVGLDRGFGDSGTWLRWRRAGNRVVFEIPNARYIASTTNQQEAAATAESFAVSIIHATPILATRADGALLIDLTDFLLRDPIGTAQRLQATGQGSYNVAADRSFVSHAPLAFPDNLEFDATLTLAGRAAGREVRATAPDPDAITLGVHHSFVRLPASDYTPLVADARAAAISLQRYDLARPLAAPLVERLARRFDLELRRNDAGQLVVGKPIVFYVDSGAPEPVRSALVEGANWWADAFAAAGLPGAYRVEVLPDGVHPLDVRYNVIQWVHRQTRGWSYGGGVADPRTGEMLKGHVILGSQRIRHDRMIFEGLLGRQNTGTGREDDPLEIALARVRQLSAHEVGHALGFAHNMAASSNDRASVMDYPAPRIRVAPNGSLDTADAYSVGIGEWDKVTVRWLYADLNDNERDQVLRYAFDRGLVFVEDAHSRPVGGAHPAGSLWDNGADPVKELLDVLAVRRHAIERFGPDRVDTKQPLSDLQTAFTPIYLYHRYQTVAAAKLIGGTRFDYAPAGQATAMEAVSPDDARRALQAVLATIAPATLAVDPALQAYLQPPNDAWEPIKARERFAGQTHPLFDARAAASAAAALSINALTHSDRLERVARAQLEPGALSLAELFSAIVATAFETATESNAERVAQGAIQETVVTRFLQLANNSQSSAAVRGQALQSLEALAAALENRRARLLGSPVEHRAFARLIRQGLEVPSSMDGQIPEEPVIPPGSPIGGGMAESCWFCD